MSSHWYAVQCVDERACKYHYFVVLAKNLELIFDFDRFRTLEPDDVCKACRYKDGSAGSDNDGSPGKYKKPEWRHEYNCGKQYQPSFNVAPTDVTPVLVSAAHFDDSDGADSKQHGSKDRLLVPMMWGMIPFWHHGSDYRNHGLTTNNCRMESMLQSKLYANALRKGQRCVVLCEGFYEWQTTDPKATKASQRAAYYAYMPQSDDIRIEERSTWTNRVGELNLLKMAGLFDCWTNDNGDHMYSYSIITFESDEKFNWLHHRSPAILETEQQISDWLDFGRVNDSKVLMGMLKPATQLKWHPVSSLVNNSRNKSSECNKPLNSDGNKKPGPAKPMNKMMQSWLIVGKRKAEDGDKDGQPDEKKKIKDEKE